MNIDDLDIDVTAMRNNCPDGSWHAEGSGEMDVSATVLVNCQRVRSRFQQHVHQFFASPWRTKRHRRCVRLKITPLYLCIDGGICCAKCC